MDASVVEPAIALLFDVIVYVYSTGLMTTKRTIVYCPSRLTSKRLGYTPTMNSDTDELGNMIRLYNNTKTHFKWVTLGKNASIEVKEGEEK